MSKPQTLEDFYRQKIHWLPDNLKQDIGHFNVFRLDDFVGPSACHLPYSRKDFYKITLVTGRSNYHFADKTVEIRGNALLFANPLVPYDWEPLDDNQSGYFCIFTEAFLQRYQLAGALELPLFRPGGQPLYSLTDAQREAAAQLFAKMAAEIDSDYAYKYDLLRNYVFELIHSALKLQPATTLYKDSNAATRIASLFTELLERQFPIETPGQQVRLRTANAFAGQLAVHVNHLNRALKEVTGKTTTQLIAARLTQEAHALLRHTSWNVSEISYSLGFEEPAHFNNFFRKQAGTTPTAVRSV
ncbi:helix-turn-helix domain-containing protein [Hymenobacter cellulosilyticus]|uniref:Helix-turn-helix transcriptional regulator n=1 Tax=Hymenobacter cellulosilyticus TaxID=2932248 RepID=A0A8T9Q2T7_9BACT|nr:helix-turn-helix domain-containing protein [Hymenobacter cellulosilyticus]UOQ71767.1 helix-turn-helix transcriptional regulator [Hymenobacter cellulosilyticus]